MSTLSDSPSTSDVGALWIRALEKYKRLTKIDLREMPEKDWALKNILNQQEQDLRAFKNVRHNGGKVDSFRTWITSNSDIIQNIVGAAVEATESVFPPVKAIVLTMNIVVGASNRVTADYDMVESFFGIMHTFLQRLALLEHAIPREPEYQEFLINVFEQLLVLSGIAHKYCKEKNGRLRKWVTKLAYQEDDDLNVAYKSLNDNLKELESANIMMTLRKVLETKTTLDSSTKLISDGIQKLGKKGDENTVRVLESITSMQTEMTSRDNQVHTMISTGFARVNERLGERVSEQDSRATMKGKNLASKNSHALQFLVDQIGGKATGKLKAKRSDLEHSYVKGTCLWVEEEAGFSKFKQGKVRFLWIVGKAGMGKSTICDHLQRSFSSGRLQFESGAVVTTSFIFDESFRDLRDCKSMMNLCALEAAGIDPEYRQALMNEKETMISERQDGNVDVETYWEKLFTSKFTTLRPVRDKKLVLILDGVDQMVQEEQNKMLNCLCRTVNGDCSIQIILTSHARPVTMPKEIGASISWIDITSKNIAPDLLRVAKARANDSSLARLSKLRQKFRKRVARDLSQRADNFLYLEQMFRRFNALGREHLIAKELSDLPDDTQTLYATILKECEKNRSRVELGLLRDLFTWIAYSRDTLTLGASKSLLDLLSQTHGISVEEELDGRLSRLLRTSTGDSLDDDNTDQSGNEDANAQENLILEGQDREYHEEMDSLLFFQESSLRTYFRQGPPKGTTEALRTDTSSAHVTMFEIISNILNRPKSAEATGPGLDRLFQYASQNWLQHFLDIQVGQLEPEQTTTVIGSLYRILTNNGDGLQRIERCIDADPFDTTSLNQCSIFGSTEELRERTLERITDWTIEASKLSDENISPDLRSWTRSLREDSVRSFVLVARSHVMNWFAADRQDDAIRSFRFAHQALLFAQRKKLAEMTQNPQLDEYLTGYTGGALTETSVIAISRAFWDIPKTPLTQRRIALVLMGLGMEDQTMVRWIQEALASAKTPPEIFELCHTAVVVKFNAIEHERFQGVDEKDRGAPELILPELVGEAREKSQEVMDFAERSLHHRPAAGGLVRRQGDAPDPATWLISDLLLIKATLHMRFRRYDYARDATVKALKSPVTQPRVLFNVIDCLAIVERWDDIASIVECFSASDIMACVFLNLQQGDYHTSITVQMAAHVTKSEEALLSLYDGFIQHFDTSEKFWAGQSRLTAAEFCYTVVRDFDRAKRYLDDALRPESDRDTKDQASMMLSDILLQQFRNGSNSDVKSPMIGEMKKQTQRIKEIQGREFQPDLSLTMIPWAHMLKQWGPTTEFQENLKSTFDGCISTLQDSNPDNDDSSFRMLARVLMMIPGLETDAAIACTLQFYDVGSVMIYSSVHNIGTEEEGTVGNSAEKTDGQDERREDDGEAAGETATTDPDSGGVTGSPSAAHARPTDAPGPADGKEPHDRMKWNSWYRCNYCGRNIHDWDLRGPAYMCFYCSDMDLCEKCYVGERLQQVNYGEGWRVLCPRGHQHIKSPVGGWEGIQDGVFRIKGQDIAFKDWLDDLRLRKWPGAWNKFWLAGTEKSVCEVSI